MSGFNFWGQLTAGGVVAATVAYAATPLAIATARRLSFYDRPAGYKGHSAPTPYLGGAAVMLAFAVALLLGAGHPQQTLPLLGGVALLWVLGTVDDRRQVSPLVRVVVEFALAVVLSLLGLGWHLAEGQALDALINGIWVLGIINAFNLFDNMDGAASTMGLVVACGACALGWLNGNAWSVAGSAALAGACLGFLPHNLAKPARIFLGDGGSMPLGFAVAMLVASAARGSEPGMLSLLTGLLLIGLPALDTTLVIISRRRRGISILTGGQDHLTHRTRLRVRTARRVALVLGATQAVISALVIVAVRTSSATEVYILLGFTVLAAMAILALEQAVEPGSSLSAPHPGDAIQVRSRRWMTGIPPVVLVLIGLGAGASSFFNGYYNLGVWISIGLVLVIAAALGYVVRPPRVTLPLGLTLAGLAGLGLFSLLSTGWAGAAEQATTAANRWLAYAALLLLTTLLIRRPRHANVLLIAVGAGIALVAADVLARMLAGHGSELFIGGRLSEPLGYIDGEGCVFAMGCWLCIAAAERPEPVVAGAGAAGAVISASLALLSQSRGAAIATFIAIIVVLLAVPGRPRRVFSLAIVGAALALALHPLLTVYTSGGSLTSVFRQAAAAALAAAAVTGILWGGLVYGSRRLLHGANSGAGEIRRKAAVLAAMLAIAPVGIGLLHAPSLAHDISIQWHAFVHISDSASAPASTQTRLLSGSGTRYDYWRIAWKVFRMHPVGGVGGGNYTSYYYRYRQTNESIENPHSLELQTLSELGVIGALFLALAIVGVLLGARRLRRQSTYLLPARTLSVATSGVLIVWLVDTSGDWMHLLPGVTAVALSAAAVLCASPTAGGALTAEEPRLLLRRPRPHVLQLVGGALLALVLSISGANLLRQGLAHRYVTRAQHELSARPAAAVGDASRALRLDAANLDAFYVKAAGEARYDQAASARATLLAAAREDSQDFVTWVLLGDLEVRLRNFPAAKDYYERARRLDPNDATVASLAADPAATGP